MNMLNAFVCAAGNRSHGHHFFRVVIRNSKEAAEFTIPDLIIRDHVGCLDVQAFPLFFTNKIGLLFTDLPNGDLISSCFQMGEYNVFNNFIDV